MYDILSKAYIIDISDIMEIVPDEKPKGVQ